LTGVISLGGRQAPHSELDPITGQHAPRFDLRHVGSLGEPAKHLACLAATTAQAKLAGLWIERSEQTRKQPDEMSDALRQRLMSGGGAKVDGRALTYTAAQILQRVWNGQCITCPGRSRSLAVAKEGFKVNFSLVV
jgi:hypothetical protein